MVPAKVEFIEFPTVNVLGPAPVFVMVPLPDNARVIRLNVLRSIVPVVARSRVPFTVVIAFSVVVPDVSGAMLRFVNAPVPEMV